MDCFRVPKADDAYILAERGYAYLQTSQGKNSVDDYTKVIGLYDQKTGRFSNPLR
jgi:hypothetical protein